MINTIKKFFKKITKYIYSSIFLLSLLIITLLFKKDKIIEGFNCSNLKIKVEIQFVVDEYDETNPPIIESVTVDNIDDNGNRTVLNFDEDILEFNPIEENSDDPDNTLIIEDISFKNTCNPNTNRITFLHKGNASYDLIKFKISSGNTIKTVNLADLECEDNQYYSIDFEPVELKNFIP